VMLDNSSIDVEAARQEHLAVAQRLVEGHPEIRGPGPRVHNMPPYRRHQAATDCCVRHHHSGPHGPRRRRQGSRRGPPRFRSPHAGIGACRAGRRPGCGEPASRMASQKRRRPPSPLTEVPPGAIICPSKKPARALRERTAPPPAGIACAT
jgi:hypothetical protein